MTTDRDFIEKKIHFLENKRAQLLQDDIDGDSTAREMHDELGDGLLYWYEQLARVERIERGLSEER